MKRSVIYSIDIIILLVVVALASPYIMSFYWSNKIEKDIATVNKSLPDKVQYSLTDFQRGYLKSFAKITLNLDLDGQAIQFNKNMQVLHGPLILEKNKEGHTKWVIARGKFIGNIKSNVMERFFQNATGGEIAPFIRFKATSELDGTLHGHFKSWNFDHQDPKNKLKWGGLKGYFQTDNNYSSYRIGLESMPLIIDTKDKGKIDIDRISFDFDGNKKNPYQLLTGRSDIKLPGLKVTDYRHTDRNFNLSDLKATTEIKLKGEKLHEYVTLAINNMQFGQHEEGSLNFAVKLKEFDAPALFALRDHLNNRSLNDIPDKQKTMNLVLNFLSKGMQNEINGTLSLKKKGNALMKMTLNVDPFSASDNLMMAIPEIITAIHFKANLKISDAILRTLLQDLPVPEGQSLTEVQDAQINKLLQEKLLVKEGNDYLMDMSFDNQSMELLINGLPQEAAEKNLLELFNR